MSLWPLLTNIIGVAVIVIIFGLALAVVYRLAFTPDALSGLIAEPADANGQQKASLSRFQFLVFTFVVAGLFLLLSIEAGTFVEVPPTVLGLIGISGGAFVISKGISKSDPKSDPKSGPNSAQK